MGLIYFHPFVKICVWNMVSVLFAVGSGWPLCGGCGVTVSLFLLALHAEQRAPAIWHLCPHCGF